MKLRSVKLFSAAFIISLVGSLPVGTLNAGVATYALNHNFMGALKFSVGAVLVEAVMARVALLLIEKLSQLKTLFRILGFFMCIIMLLLAYRTLSDAAQTTNFQRVSPFSNIQPLYAGIVLSLLNPLHIPFWAAWTAVLKRRKLLNDNSRDYAVCLAAIATGTLTAFFIYGIASAFLLNTSRIPQTPICWIMGIVFLLTGLVQAYKLMGRKFKTESAESLE